MPTNLATRAQDAATAIAADVATVADALTAAREDLRSRAEVPTDPADWASELGAMQHAAVAREALAGLRTEQARVRAELAALDSPGAADALETELRDLLIDDASMQVEVRAADERVAAAEARIAALGSLLAEAESHQKAAETRAHWGEEHQALGEALRTSLGEAPLDSVEADASSALGAPLDDAEDRLEALLPTALRDRALARAEEARTLVADAAAHAAVAQDAVDELAETAAPLEAAVALAEADFLAAETALRRYAADASTEVAAASAQLAAVAAVEDLAAGETAALDPAAHADGEDAATAESTLAGELPTLHAAERDVADAELTALVDDPSVDLDGVPDVQAARDDRDDAATAPALVDARDDYDDAAVRALDEWEVEVPESLWTAVDRFAAARHTLERLADATTRTDLVQALDAAQDALATALDDHDLHVRRTIVAQHEAAQRTAVLAAAVATAGDRRRHYLRGDGPGGRTADQL